MVFAHAAPLRTERQKLRLRKGVAPFTNHVSAQRPTTTSRPLFNQCSTGVDTRDGSEPRPPAFIYSADA